jgi:lipopolysaccharide/colanic/teichoic acid biosynthesis glycosyltransferase
VNYPLWKRALDVFGSLIGIIIIIPLFPFIALAIKLQDGGTVLVKLPRVSEGMEIYVYKFRSMIPDAMNRKKNLEHLNERKDGPFFKMKHDPRVTKVGKLLRKFRLDEFPQLWNVLKGDLALVGPRPHEQSEIVKYPIQYSHLPILRSGVTGLSQVSGASSLSFMKELELDDYYSKHSSLWGDLKIVIRTVAILFTDPTAV